MFGKNAQDVTAHDEPAEPAAHFSEYELQRAGWFEELGFSDLQALVLATTRDSSRQLVTVHDVRKALARGCSVEQAFEIFA